MHKRKKSVGNLLFKINEHYQIWYNKLSADSQLFFPKPLKSPISKKYSTVTESIMEDVRQQIGVQESFEERQNLEREQIA